MVKCPRCASEAKDFRKQWNYQQLSVKLFDCPKCEKAFKAYYRNEKFAYTIPKAKK